MLTCPHCRIGICLRELPHQGLLASFRICPNCGGRFTVDARTKRRQAVFIVIALVSLAFTMLLYFRGSQWLIPAFASYIVLGVLLYWGNKRVLLVPHEDQEDLGNRTTDSAPGSRPN